MKTKYVVLIHSLFWFYIINQALFPIYIGTEVEFYYYVDLPFTTVLNVINFYFFYYYIIPPVFNYRKKTPVILLCIFAVLLFAAFRELAGYFYYRNLFGFTDTILFGNHISYLNYFRITFITSLYALLIKFAIDWFYNQKIRAELIKQNQASELALLRSQINPHFLFNTLNNIYSLVYKKSDEAPEAVMKLSGIMRYMLYDANTDKVPLEKEIEYLRSFIELQKLRTRHKDFVEMNVTGDLNSRMITPMLLIPFVENAFKHGSRKTASPGIKVDLRVDQQRLEFEVTNYCKKNTIQTSSTPGGIGLHNIKRRLDLMYPKLHSLDIQQDDDQFKVKLIIYYKNGN